MSSKERGRRWCFTLNNWHDSDVESLKKMTDIKYMIVGIEVGEKGTPHMQGYVRVKTSICFNTVK